jgi:hypothetical protein
VRLSIWLLLAALSLPAQTVYYTLWFDTEDYIDPRADDAAMKLAQGLERMGVKATFKVVAEKARVLERRNRQDVIRALAAHDIGYHSENHSIPPTPAQYLSTLGMLEGAAEFERREGPGLREVERIFGKKASTYGQPGNSWGPQSTVALRRLGVPTYVDEARQILLNNQPFWYGGILHVYNLGPFSVRTELNDRARLAEAKGKFDEALAKLTAQGGGVIQTYYHPTEWPNVEFWDGVNFRNGAYAAPKDYKLPKQRPAAGEAAAYEIFFEFIQHVKKKPNVKIVVAADLARLMPDRVAAATAEEARETWRNGITFNREHSAAELLLALLGMKPQYVDGPAGRTATLARATSWSQDLWERSLADVRSFIETHKRLPAEVWVGSDRLSLADFAATLASGERKLVSGKLLFEKHLATDGKKEFNWVIHPEGFDGSQLLEMGRWQAWTLKPARIGAPGPGGTYLGELATPAGKLRLALNVSETGGALTSEMISLDQNNAKLAASETKLEGRKLSVSLPQAMAGYVGEFNDDYSELRGTFTQGRPSELVLRRVNEIPRTRRPQTPQGPFPYRAEDVSFSSKAEGVKLAGTLTMPSAPGKYAAAILLSGSGPQDRDETLFEHKPFLVLADHLTRQGIAVLRYDDRGIGKSGGSFAGSTSADFADDARGAVAYLRSRSDIDGEKIVIIGHSEGGLIAPMVAATDERIAAVVSLSGPAMPGERIVKRQTVDLARAAGLSEEQAKSAGQVGYAQMEAQSKTDAWMRFFWTYDPGTDWAKVKCPALALNGSLDMQVNADENLAAIRAANAQVTVKKLDGLNHLFQKAQTGAGLEYGRIEETFAPGAMEEIAGWLLKVLR